METVERQKVLVNGSIATLFNEWEQQLRDKIEACNLLKKDVKRLQNNLVVKDAAITHLQTENVHLKQEVARLQASSVADASPRLKSWIEKHNNLYEEHELLKATAAANQHDLIKQLRKERKKLRRWNHFSSPGALPPYKQVASTSDPVQNRLDPTGRPKARFSFSGDEDHADGLSHAQENLSYKQKASVSAGNEAPQSKINDNGSFEGPPSSTDTLRKGFEASKGSRLMEQPPKATELDASFVDAHLPDEPRAPSPELPSMPGTRRTTLKTGKEAFTATNETVSQGSLPQVRRSDSTAPPSEGSEMIEKEGAPADDAPSSDTPEFLGARSIRKNASREVNLIGQLLASNANEPVTIKSDADTSFVVSRSPRLTRQESSIHGSLDPSTSMIQPRSPRKHRPPPVLPPPSTEENRRHARTILGNITPQRATSEPMSVKGPRPLSDQSTNGRGNTEQATPLRQIDGNARNGQNHVGCSSNPKSRKRKYENSRGVEAIPTISEDGEEFTIKARRTSRDRTSSPRPANPGVHQRLVNLLARPPAPKELLPQISRKTIEDMDRCLSLATLTKIFRRKRPFNELIRCDEKDWEWWDEARALLVSHKDRSPEMPLGHPRWQQKRRDRNIQNASTPKSTLTPPRPPGPTPTTRPAHVSEPIPGASSSPAAEPPSHTPYRESPSHPPYRSLPLPSLNLTHFKLNPAANHNLTYAYTDVVRNQSERKCLPGCTRPECCGAGFAALAQTLPQSHPAPDNYTSTNNDNNNNNNNNTTAPPITPADEAILTEYLGPYQFSTLPASQPTPQLLLAARTAHLATKYGKAHRAPHQRAPSPPGFWNVDFPGTQERGEDRAEAERRERAEVGRRWREARKNVDPGERSGGGVGGGGGRSGLWMFADE